MKAVILAAGEGRRLRPFTETMPKVMLPIANKPIIEHIVDSLKKTGIDEIIIVVGYKKEVVMEHFKEYDDVKIKFVFQDKQLGTSHALLQAKEYIKESFLVLSGDNIIDHSSITELISDNSEYSMMIKEHPHPSKYGIVFLKDDNLDKIEKQPKQDIGHFISTGIYKFPASIFKKIKDFTSKGDYSLFSVIQSLVDEGKSIHTINSSLWMDIVYPWDLIAVNAAMNQNYEKSISGTIEKNVTLKGSVVVGKDTVISSGCYIIGPVVIGSGCEIGPNVCIFPSTTIGDNSVIHPFNEIRNSVIMNDVHIGSNSFIQNSVVSKGTALNNNFSSSSGERLVSIGDECKEIKNIGALIGEDCNFGNHVVVDPGIIVGRKCSIDSMKRIRKDVESNSKVM